MKIKVGNLTSDEEVIALRNIDPFTVSRYRIAMRSGAIFPRIVVDSETHKVVSGNHTMTAILGEYGEDHVIYVDTRKFKDVADKIEFSAARNVAHGRPLDSYSKNKIRLALMNYGRTEEEIARLLNTTVACLRRLDDRLVFVRGKKSDPVPVKSGTTIPDNRTFTADQLAYNQSAEIGISTEKLADTLRYRIQNGMVSRDADSAERLACWLLAGALDMWK